MTLTERITAWMLLPASKDEAYLTELSEIYFEITGQRVICKGCNYTTMKRVLRQYLTNNTTTQETTLMTSSKYQFAAGSQNQTIILHYPGTTKAVTAQNLTDADAEYILNSPGLKANYGHHIELKKVVLAPAEAPVVKKTRKAKAQ